LLDPCERGFETLAPIDPTDLRFDFRGFAEAREESVRRNALQALAVNGPDRAQNGSPGIETEHSIANPGFFENFPAPIFFPGQATIMAPSPDSPYRPTARPRLHS
jgi:hypothetical protein